MKWKTRLVVCAISTLAFMTGGVAGPPGSPRTTVSGDASCDGQDHDHWHVGWNYAHQDHWVFVRTRSKGPNQYQNYFRNETHGYGEWSGDCVP